MKITDVIMATFFNVVSIDFLLQYSFELSEAHQIQKPTHHFGLIKSTDNMKRVQDTSITAIRIFLIIKME